MTNAYRKVLPSYAAQARFLHTNIRSDEHGDWLLAEWTRLVNGAVKPVYRLLDGTPVVITNGRSHTQAVVLGVDETNIKATEDACY